MACPTGTGEGRGGEGRGAARHKRDLRSEVGHSAYMAHSCTARHHNSGPCQHKTVEKGQGRRSLGPHFVRLLAGTPPLRC
jgi:hypothetical protein